MAKVKYELTLEHSEARQAPLDAAIQRFRTRLRNIGYTPVAESLSEVGEKEPKAKKAAKKKA